MFFLDFLDICKGTGIQRCVPLLHGRQLYPTVESGIIAADEVGAVLSCKGRTEFSIDQPRQWLCDIIKILFLTTNYYNVCVCAGSLVKNIHLLHTGALIPVVNIKYFFHQNLLETEDCFFHMLTSRWLNRPEQLYCTGGNDAVAVLLNVTKLCCCAFVLGGLTVHTLPCSVL